MEMQGFVDLQVNGHGGVDFADGTLTAERFVEACEQLAAAGTGLFLPTLTTAPVEVYEHDLPLIAAAIDRGDLPLAVPGMHVEGPFLSPEPGARGAHNPRWIRPPELDLLKRLLDLAGGHVSLLTVAPELPGVEALISHAAGEGIAVACGHTLAGPDDLKRAADAGATLFTHLGNGLPNLIHRHHNPIWAALANDELTATIISDGHHLPPAAIKTILRAKGPGRVIVVSDASHLAGMPPGNYSTSDNEIVLEPSGKLHNPAKQCLAGSSATMLDCMNHLASLNLLTPAELLTVGVDNPLGALGLTRADLPAQARVRQDENTGLFSAMA